MSVQMKFIAAFLRLTSKPRMASAQRARTVMAAPKPPTVVPESLRERHEVTSRQVGQFTCYTVAPKGRAAQRAAVYLHGGAYIGGFSPQHWTLISELVTAGVRVEAPDYGLAPQHTYRDAYPFVTAVYRELLAARDAFTVTIAGDSAGAGLALGFAQTLPAAGLPQPGRLLLIAPWLDLTLSNPAVAAVHDPWLSRAGLVEAGRAWAGGDDPAEPRLSPINGPMAGLAPIRTYVGTRDLFHPDAVRLGELAAAAGTPIDVTVSDGAVHVYPLVPAPEGRTAQSEIVQLIAG